MHPSNQPSESQVSSTEDLRVLPGELDGMTIMRYAHLSRGRASGGVEQYLQHLDLGLLERHRLTILQMYMTKDDTNEAIEVEHVGKGRILWVPVTIRERGGVLADLPKRMGYLYRRSLRMYQQQGKGEYGAKLSAMGNVLSQAGRHLRYKTAILSDHLCHLLVTQNVDLLALHWMSYDIGALISRARKAEIPIVVINHFSNTRFSLPLTRKWITSAAAVAGVSDVGIPDYLHSRVVNLSDAVDTEFFDPEKVRPAGRSPLPIVLLPGRIDYGKGHHDLMEAARILIARKFEFIVCFAGAVEEEAVHQEIRRSAVQMGLEERVLFLGERSPEEIREWYARSSMVVLPSYSEGLARVLLEAQAMKKPVVTYDSGGTSRAILPQETGFLVKTGDVESLADKIIYLLENEAEGRRMGERGRQFVSRKFSLAALIQRHEAFYLSVLSGVRARRKGSPVERPEHG